jgi:hypothetical protein
MRTPSPIEGEGGSLGRRRLEDCLVSSIAVVTEISGLDSPRDKGSGKFRRGRRTSCRCPGIARVVHLAFESRRRRTRGLILRWTWKCVAVYALVRSPFRSKSFVFRRCSLRERCSKCSTLNYCSLSVYLPGEEGVSGGESRSFRCPRKLKKRLIRPPSSSPGVFEGGRRAVASKEGSNGMDAAAACILALGGERLRLGTANKPSAGSASLAYPRTALFICGLESCPASERSCFAVGLEPLPKDFLAGKLGEFPNLADMI